MSILDGSDELIKLFILSFLGLPKLAKSGLF